MTIKKFFVKTWNDLVRLQQRGWIYRGQREESWQLETTLERVIRRHKGRLKTHAPRVETAFLREFMRRFHHYSDYVPHERDELEWFALMQHHGPPTRLLDWTMSIFVASYFALESADKDCAVWAIDQTWLHECCKANDVQGLVKYPAQSKPRLARILTEKYRSFDAYLAKQRRQLPPPIHFG